MQLEDLEKLVMNALEDLKGVNITTLDVGQQTDITDRMIIATGTSTRHVNALAENVIMEAKKAGSPALGSEGEPNADWVLVDLGDIVVHVMLAETRELYDLEKLWTFVEREKNDQQG